MARTSVLALGLHLAVLTFYGCRALHVTVSEETFDVYRNWKQAPAGKPIPREIDHGCNITGTRLTYQCPHGRSQGGGKPQLLSFRVDCRGGKAQNITLYQTSGQCHRMSYRRISKSMRSVRNSSYRVPFIADHAVTLQKEEVVDIQCIMRPFNFNETRFTHETATGQRYEVDFKMVLDGQVGLYHVFNPILLETSCLTYLEELYDWNMKLVKSVNSTRHVVRYSSPLFESKDLFPTDFGDGSVMETGTFFEVDKDELYARIAEATSSPPLELAEKETLVKLNPNFYSSSNWPNRFAVDFELEVNLGILSARINYVKVKMGVVPNLKTGESRFFILELPVRSVDIMEAKNSGSFEKLVIWWLVVFMLVMLAAAMAYVYRDQWLDFTRTFHSNRTTDRIGTNRNSSGHSPEAREIHGGVELHKVAAY